MRLIQILVRNVWRRGRIRSPKGFPLTKHRDLGGEGGIDTIVAVVKSPSDTAFCKATDHHTRDSAGEAGGLTICLTLSVGCYLERPGVIPTLLSRRFTL